MNKKHVIIDCDPGHDDVMAILSAIVHPEIFEILGVTTVCGNQLLPLVTENILNVLAYINHPEIPVFSGCDLPLVYPPSPQDAHGYNGLEGFEFPAHTLNAEKKHAIELMRESILSSPQKVTIMALAPLTNIATLPQKYPEVKNKIAEVVMMGGSIDGGNVLPYAEFNIYADPHAAKQLFETNIPITLIPLECCEDCTISDETIEKWGSLDHPIAKMIFGLMEFFAIYGRARGRNYHTIFDLAVTMYLTHPEIFQGSHYDVEVILTGEKTRGQTICKYNQNSHIRILEHAKQDLFERYIQQDITLLCQKDEVSI